MHYYRNQLVLFILLIFTLPIFTQSGSQRIDSLEKIILHERDSSQVDAYKEIAKLYLLDSIELSILYIKTGIERAKEIGYQKGHFNLILNLATTYDIAGEFDMAMKTYDDAEALFRANNDNTYLASVHQNRGVAYFYAGDLGQALQFYLIAYNIAKEGPADESYAYLLNNIGVTYRSLGKYQEALEIYQEALAVKETLGDQLGAANTLQNISTLYSHLSDHEQARAYLEKARDGFAQLGDPKELATIDLTLSDNYLRAGDLDLAVQTLEQLYNDNISKLEKSEQIQALILMTRVYNLNGQPATSLERGEEGLQQVSDTKWNNYKRDFYQQAADSYERLNMPHEALDAFKQTLGIELLLKSEERQEFEQEMQVKFNTQLKEQEIERLQIERELDSIKLSSRRNQLLLALGGLVIFLITSILLYRLYRKIQSQNKIIGHNLEEKNILLREIHHRVKNNLQVISSILSWQGRHSKDPIVDQAIKESKDRVKSMSLIHQNLYQKEDVTGVNIHKYFKELIRNLFDSYNIDADRVGLKMHIPPLNLDVDTVIPIGLIVNELVSNALKHAFPNGSSGEILVSLLESDDRLILKVKDNGVGFGEHIIENDSNGFGYELIQSFRDKMKAEMEILNEKGTTVKLEIQNYKRA